MKKILLLTLLFVGNFGFSQGYKQDINVELLTEIISKKQDEIRKVVIQNTLKKASAVTNLATANTTMNVAHTLLDEKNKETMKRRILQELTFYAITYSIKNDAFNDFMKLKENKSLISSFNLNNQNISYEEIYSNLEFKAKTKEITQIENKSLDSIEMISSYMFDTIYRYLSENINSYNLTNILPTLSSRKMYFSGNEFDYDLMKNNDEIKKFMNEYIKNLKTKLDNIQMFNELIKYDFSNLKFNDLSVEKVDSLVNILTPIFKLIDGKISKNNVISNYFNIILKYIIIDENPKYPDHPEKKYYTIDVEAIILELENSIFNNRTYGIEKHCIGFQPFFNIGLNYGWFANQKNEFNFDNSLTSLSSMAWAGEKIGVKIVFADWKYTRSHVPKEWYKYRGTERAWNYAKNDLYVNKFYLNIYGSGLLYNIANLKTEDKFDYAIAGSHLGVEMFNGLDISIGFAIPFIKGYNARETFNNGFVNLSFDVPIFEYIREARKD